MSLTGSVEAHSRCCGGSTRPSRPETKPTRDDGGFRALLGAAATREGGAGWGASRAACRYLGAGQEKLAVANPDPRHLALVLRVCPLDLVELPSFPFPLVPLPVDGGAHRKVSQLALNMKAPHVFSLRPRLPRGAGADVRRARRHRLMALCVKVMQRAAREPAAEQAPMKLETYDDGGGRAWQCQSPDVLAFAVPTPHCAVRRAAVELLVLASRAVADVTPH